MNRIFSQIRKTLLKSGKFTGYISYAIGEIILLMRNLPDRIAEMHRGQWNKSAKEILNLINGLSPYPGAYTMIKNTEGSAIQLKIFAAQYQISDHKMDNGQIHSDGKTKFKIACTDGFVLLKEVQIAGKKRMNIEAFLKGFYINDGWIAE